MFPLIAFNTNFIECLNPETRTFNFIYTLIEVILYRLICFSIKILFIMVDKGENTTEPNNMVFNGNTRKITVNNALNEQIATIFFLCRYIDSYKINWGILNTVDD